MTEVGKQQHAHRKMKLNDKKFNQENELRVELERKERMEIQGVKTNTLTRRH